MDDSADIQTVIDAARGCTAVWDSRSELVAKRLGGGTTNRVYLVSDSSNSSVSVVVRVYGSDTGQIIDRERELAVTEALSRMGRVPKVLGRFAGGVVTTFVQGRTLCALDIAQPAFSVMVAAELARWHALDCRSLNLGPPTMQLWTLLASWITACQEQQHRKPTLRLCEFAAIQREATFLESVLPHASPSGRVPTVAMCHNDVQSLNVISDPTTDAVCFIDLEYAAFNTPYFDIGNHFCEWGGLECDYSKFPKPEQQRIFIEAYLTELACERNDKPPTTADIELERQAAEQFSLASHLLWAVWGVFQACKKPSSDFDYVAYALKRLMAYDAFKSSLHIIGGSSRPLSSCIEQ